MFDVYTLTVVHTVLSIIAIGAGPVAIAALFGARQTALWSQLFLGTAVATSVTGYFFPFNGITPAQVVGALALIVLAAVLFAAYVRRFDGAWRWIYAVGMVVSLYFLVFVAIVQAFLKVPALNALAPNQTELPFTAAQLVVLAGFAWLAVQAARRFDPTPDPARSLAAR